MKKNTPLHIIIILLTVLALTSIAAAGSGAPRVTTLSGAEEVPPADPDGTGFATIKLNVGPGMVCWEISFEGIDAPFAAHIHAAPVGVNGPVVVPLSPIAGGCTSADPALIQAIIDFPERYYVNVHNASFPGGAIRGQLSNPGQSN
jgi:hypothetical protein